jgi:23S rRNA (uracil1939-C5)-methyltransferase
MGLEEEAQRAWKRQIVVDALQRLGGFSDVPVAATVASPSALGYRNKIELTFGPVRLGFHPPGEPREVVDIAACLLADPAMGRVVDAARGFFLRGPGAGDPALPRPGDRREPLRLVVRRSAAEGTLLAALRGEPGPFPTALPFAHRLMREVPEVVGVARLLVRRGRRGGTRVEALAGRTALREVLGGIAFEVPAAAFFQVNPEAAERLLGQVLDAALPVDGQEVLELYGGMGMFGLAMARAGARVTVCEADQESVAAGRKAALRAGLPVRFLQGDVARCLGGSPQLVLADPPRSGFAPGVAARIAALSAARLVIVSCDPATLARDLRALSGYAPERVVPVDLFPQTPHVETVTRLRRIGPRTR